MKKLLLFAVLLTVLTGVGGAFSLPTKTTVNPSFTDTIEERIHTHNNYTVGFSNVSFIYNGSSSYSVEKNETVFRDNGTVEDVYNISVSHGDVVSTSTSNGLIDTIIEDYNQSGLNRYIFSHGGTWRDVKATDSDGNVIDMDLTIELEPNNITKILVANKEPWKTDCGTTTEKAGCFNDDYRFKDGDINTTQIENLDNERENLYVYKNGEPVKQTNLKSQAKNLTVKIRGLDNDPYQTVQIGNNSLVVQVTSQSDWNQGQFNGTSADRAENSGILGVGYRNASSRTTGFLDSVVGQWRFDGNANDYSGNNNDGTVNTGVSVDDEAVFSTKGANFSTGHGGIDVSDSNSLDITDDISVSLWVKPNPTGKDDGEAGTWLDKSDFTGSNNQYTLGWEDRDCGSCEPNSLRWLYNSHTHVPTGEPFADGDTGWEHVVVTHDISTDTSTVYINGSEWSSLTEDTGTPSGNSLDLSFGETTSLEDREWEQQMDELMLWNRKLSSEEVRDLYFAGRDGTFDGEYNRTQINVPAGEAPSQLTTNRTNIDTTGNTSTWNITHYGSFGREFQEVSIPATSTWTEDNSSLNFNETGGKVNVSVAIDADQPRKTPLFDSYQVWTAASNKEPAVNTLECRVNGTTWLPCSRMTSFGFADNFTEIRANVTDPEGDSIPWVNFTVWDKYDNNNRFIQENYTSKNGDLFIFDVPPAAESVNDSGSWNASAEASDGTATNTNSSTWTVAWGTLNVTMTNPTSKVSVQQNSEFNMTGKVECLNGECASETDGSGGPAETIELWADPYEQKVEVSGPLTAGEEKAFSSTVGEEREQEGDKSLIATLVNWVVGWFQ